ncbi:molybdopterin-dependent oxidoreductase [Streptomyces marincola]|uniref:Molybdopterin-binding protein n=1 Tax=Streptomyces marincola TaxID=2878388 RepID=A0A1W7CXB4_9ACTN|nr:molybdopterin-dependent oxidoreductase [Streptomyces marincola]ARQ69458.1 molybdopterin-binding protein [Streptomyces marincola]
MTASVTARKVRKPSSLRYYQDGPPRHVDPDRWRLTVAGLGVPGVSLGLPRLTELPRVHENRRYVCVCNWSMRENWSGFLLSDVLALAGWDGETEGRYLKQASIGTAEKGVYESTIPLGDALERRALLVDHIDDAPMPLERGHPLRLLDFGLYGYKSVKGLARLDITDRFELGEWERRAGYALDGRIRPKRYRLSDLGRPHFIERPGEVTDV